MAKAKTDDQDVATTPDQVDAAAEAAKGTTGPEPEMTEKSSGKTVAELEQEIAELRKLTIDPRTNQPRSDFMPRVKDEADARRIDLINQSGNGGLQSSNVPVGFAREGAAQDEARRKNAQEALDRANATREDEMGKVGMSFIPPDVYKAREQARVALEAAANNVSTTVPGGRYRVGNEWVNAWGDVVDESGKVLEKRHVPIG